MKPPKDKARGNRRIDKIRESAGSTTIPPGHGNIVAVKVINGRMYFLAERGLTSAVMADHIDPERTNPDIPLVVHRVELPFGAEHRFMQRTVGAAFELIDPTYLPISVDQHAALMLAIEAAASLASVLDIAAEIRSHQRDTRAKAAAGELSAAYAPRTANLNGKVRQSIAALRDVEVAIKKLAEQFYPKEAKNDPWDKKLKPALVMKYENFAGFIEYMEKLWQILKAVADHRHAMIHADDKKHIVIRDYELEPAGAFIAPIIEIIHPDSPVARVDVVQFLETQSELLAEAYESLLGYLCDMNVRQLNDMFHSTVAEVPLGEPRNGSNLVWTTNLKEGLPSSGELSAKQPLL